MPPFRSAAPLIILYGIIGLACSGGDALIEPSVGTVEITTGTSGTGVDQGDFTVQVDGAPAQVIGPNATVWAQKIEGEHTVQLHAAGQNCVVQGENPRAVTVPAGDTVKVSFMVSCSGNTGSIRIITAATGAFQDPDGYKVTLDEGRDTAIPANDTASSRGYLPASMLSG